MAHRSTAILDGNEAVARIAYLTNEVIAIYPITPASPMGELADAWATQGRTNLWGAVPEIVQMQSEAGAAGAIHGALQSGALSTTFTSSQGLLLMLPNMYKIAGELTPAVFHVAARSLATHALSIFCDHSDVMAARATGFAILASNSVQEAADLALIAQAATLESRIPIVHFFDGFRTSHEIDDIEPVTEELAAEMIDTARLAEHGARALSPEHPVLRGSSQNPDVYFQSRERVNPYYQAMPGIVEGVMERFAALTGRVYRAFDYVGAPDAERVVILMGSGAETVEESVRHLTARGERVGVLKVRLYRPFDAGRFLAALPRSVRRIAVLDRTKEPGADGEPLYKDVATALARAWTQDGPRPEEFPVVTGGRYGLSSKEFTPGMAKAVFDELRRERPRHPFTIGIHDDVSHTSLEWDARFRTEAGDSATHCVFYGLGSDGTVSANKNSIRIIGGATGLHVQGYFVYDSKKAGAVTVSHLRFGPQPIRAPYLIGADEAQFVACHQSQFLKRYDVLAHAAPGGVFLLNSPAAPDAVWDTLPREMQRRILEKHLEFHAIDAYRIAEENGLGTRVNTVMQTCFFAISGVLPRDEAIEAIRDAVRKTYGKRGPDIVEANLRAISAALVALYRVAVPGRVTGGFDRPAPLPAEAPESVRRLTGELIAGRGDALPVSALPVDGTYPLGTAAWERRNLAVEIPVWEPDLCTHCGKCPFVCPHAAIRSKLFPAQLADAAPASFKHVPVKGRDFEPGLHISYQVAPEDCTGCGLCVEICPIRDKRDPDRKALNMAPHAPLQEAERANWAFFQSLPEYDRARLRRETIKGSMVLQPLFEFSSACVGCGETPYLRLATQLFGDRMVVANATGCSSIYGGNLPTTPWTANAEGRGPAWSNSLFEDNAEFGLGMRIAIDQQARQARVLLEALRPSIGDEPIDALTGADQSTEAGIHEQRERIAQLRTRLRELDDPAARRLESLAEFLIRRSVWIIGGDGWAYDIGFGGVDQVLASDRDVNILVLDTEVYSNTGGQTSKATPRGAVAKFSAAGKPGAKKDLARIAMDYGNAYVAQVAFGAKDVQTLRAFLEAESYPGPSLIIAYSPCIAHGVDLANNLRQQTLAVKSGHWPLLRYDPRRTAQGKNPLRLDYARPSIPYRDFALTETRFSLLWKTNPENAERLLRAAQEDVDARFRRYAHDAGVDQPPEPPKD
ncbi:pyruvate-flavodoxin oxidoreductase [bacterium BMS3Abin12]|nr:pyruvate-flavodoxin oxidoreductase [bacterium BMS3Abin12]